ncbi:MAG: ABC transporter ATP-binding protein [Bacilli bacterium]|nr:ABC transporter ATP-binding protein [Bacilli bacterium]
MGKIKINHIFKIYNQGQDNEVVALNDVSFELDEGKLTIILGASGAGKSTLLNILGGMDNATSGEFLLGDKDVAKYSFKELSNYRRNDIGFIFQFYNLLPNLTAKENIDLSASIVSSPLNTDEVLKLVGLEKRGNNFPSQLSGGEQQRVAIARAIVKNPTLLLCDEPTGALDSKTGASIIKLLYDVANVHNRTVVIVTHNSEIAKCGQRIIRIADGQIVENTINEHPLDPSEVKW